MAYKRAAPEPDQYDPRGPPAKKPYPDPYGEAPPQQYSQPPPAQYSQPPPAQYSQPPPAQYAPPGQYSQLPPAQYAPPHPGYAAPDPYAQYPPHHYAPPAQYPPAAAPPAQYPPTSYYTPYAPSPYPAYHPPASYQTPSANVDSNRCRHFARGHCKLGEGCKFSHDGAAGDNKNRCRHFATKGFCNMGDGCSFSHEGSAGDMTIEQFISQGGVVKAADPSPFNPATFNGGFGVAPGYAPQSGAPTGPTIITGSARGSLPCRHFQRGFCRLGEKCGFAHVGAPTDGSGVPPPSVGPGVSSDVVELAKAKAEEAAKAISAALERKNAGTAEAAEAALED